MGMVLVQGWAWVFSSQRAAAFAGFGVEEDVEMGGGEALEVLRAGVEGGGDVHGDAHLRQEPGDLGHVVAVAEAKAVAPRMLQETSGVRSQGWARARTRAWKVSSAPKFSLRE
jgi:hypothetical protein